MKCDVGFIQN